MTLAIDAGGTYLRAELYKDTLVTKSFSAKSLETELIPWIETILRDEKDIRDICVSFAGAVKDGIILLSPNIKVSKHHIKSYFEEKFNLNFFIANDLNCAVLAEANHFKSQNICAIYVGTGIGLGVISSSKLIGGFSGVATELGHIPYKNSPFICGCGKDNCIELFASGSGLIKHKKYNSLDEDLTLQELKNSNNKKERDIYIEFEKALLYAVATTITLFNPEILVLGGGIISSDKELIKIISSKIKDYAMPVALNNLKIVETQLQNAPLKGALLLKGI